MTMPETETSRSGMTVNEVRPVKASRKSCPQVNFVWPAMRASAVKGT